MVATKRPPLKGFAQRDHTDFHHTGPNTLAGSYLRMFWQPVYHSDELPAGHAKPITIMSVPYTLYRGEGGAPHLVDSRCLHRGMQLSPGWVEDDCIRCFYHGWKYDATGQCVEQPAEPESFASKIRIGGYPCRDYLGLVFAYLGHGLPPPFPHFSSFENFEGLNEVDSYHRACNYFNNLENALDPAHSGFVHCNAPGGFDGFTDSPTVEAEESIWGITTYTTHPSGKYRVEQFGMPNLAHIKVHPNDAEMAAYREFIAWWVPIDDENHVQFTTYAVRLSEDMVRLYVERRDARVAKRSIPKEMLGEAILGGKMRLQDVVPDSTDLLRLQDDIAQTGQGSIADHQRERLGRSDKGVILVRKLWTRELRAMAEGTPLTDWQYDLEEIQVMRDGS